MRLLALLVTVLLFASGEAALADQFDDFLAAGYRPVLTTLLPGTFTGCIKNRGYTFADGTAFVCNEKRSAFSLNPRVQFLASPDGSEHVLLIGGRAYLGGVLVAAHGIQSNPISTVAALPEATGAAGTGMAIGVIQPIEAITAILPLPDNAKLRSIDAQRYVTPPPGR